MGLLRRNLDNLAFMIGYGIIMPDCTQALDCLQTMKIQSERSSVYK